MSAIEIAIARLTASAPVKAITTAARIYPVVAPQAATAPYIVVLLVSESEPQALDGGTKLYNSRVSIQCVATTATVANNLGEVVKTAMEAMKQTIATRTNVDIYKAATDVTDYSEDRSTVRRTLDFYIDWRG